MKKLCCAVLSAVLLNTAVFGLTVDNNAEMPILIIGEETFSDVKQTDWFYDGVKFVNDKKMMSGVAEGVFAPNESLTRAMMITVLYRNAGSPETNAAQFDDVEAGSWYEKAVAWGSENGIVSGTAERTFSPNSIITREQLAVMLANYAKLNGTVQKTADLSAFSDVGDVSDWAKNAMAEMVGAGVLNGDENGRLCPKNTATRAQAAVMLSRFFK